MKEFLEILAKHVDEKGLSIELAERFVLPKLKAFVESTENKMDDLGYEGLEALIKKALA